MCLGRSLWPPFVNMRDKRRAVPGLFNYKEVTAPVITENENKFHQSPSQTSKEKTFVGKDKEGNEKK